MVIAYVGAGGKTTLIHRHAADLRARGLKVLVTTTTHMFIEEDTLLGDDAGAIIRRLDVQGYAMAGVPLGEKIGPLSPATYRAACRHADVVLVEADGSRHMPVKFPGPGEPAVPENVDEIIIVCGLHALGKTLREAAHRPDLVKKCLDVDDDAIITPEHMLRLLKDGYVRPLWERFPDKNIRVHPCHDASPDQRAIAAWLTKATLDI